MISRNSALVLKMAYEDQVAAAVDLRIGAEYPDRAVQILQRERLVDLEQHLLQRSSHPGEVLHVFRRDLRPDATLAAHERPQQVADTLQVDHELQAAEQLTRFRFRDLRERRRDLLVELLVERVELFFTFRNCTEACRRGIAQRGDRVVYGGFRNGASALRV